MNAAPEKHRYPVAVNKMTCLVSLTLDERRYALPLEQVERVIHAIDITPLPRAPEIVSGVINVLGKVIPVVNLRKRFRLRERDIALNDRIILSHTTRRPVALVVDDVNGVMELSENALFNADTILPEMQYVAGIVKLEDGMILIHDLDKCLSLEEETALDHALAAGKFQ